MAQITPNPFQPRQTFAAAALDELQELPSPSTACSCRSSSAVAARVTSSSQASGDGAPARLCTRPTIPAIVRTSDDRQTLEFAIVENLQRENLNPFEEAAGFQYLIDEYGLTQDELARRLGKSRPAVANTLRLLGLSDAIKAMLVEGRPLGRPSAGAAECCRGGPNRACPARDQ